jgi:hypothetical protein
MRLTVAITPGTSMQAPKLRLSRVRMNRLRKLFMALWFRRLISCNRARSRNSSSTMIDLSQAPTPIVHICDHARSHHRRYHRHHHHDHQLQRQDRRRKRGMGDKPLATLSGASQLTSSTLIYHERTSSGCPCPCGRPCLGGSCPRPCGPAAIAPPAPALATRRRGKWPRPGSVQKGPCLLSQ